MTFEKLHDLCNDIVEQAAKDYRKALSGARVEHKAPEKVIAECEQFFRSKWVLSAHECRRRISHNRDEKRICI